MRREQIGALLTAEPAGSWSPDGEMMFLKLGARTLLEHAVERLRRSAAEVLVAVEPQHVDRARELLGERATIHPAKATHLATVTHLCELTTAPWLLLHDPTWPLFSDRLLRELMAHAFTGGAAAAVDMPDRPTARIEAADGFMSLWDAPLGVLQSPALFRRDILERAFSTRGGGRAPTLWEALRRVPVSIAPVRNDPWNIRVASALDWEILRHTIWPLLRRRWSRAG